MIIFHNINFKIYVLILLFILVGCKLQEPLKSHGIIFLENRANKLSINQSNKNDVVKIIGNPQIIEEKNELTWIYVERILTKGKYHKLGRHELKENNVLVLEFDKYGILKKKELFNKDKIKKINFSKDNTEYKLSQRSFVQRFLQSIKQKMYGNK
jgi:outer membrane protein assembly factor BamE (lipoprotein component of BamABCDE complex)|tara:strand:- start:89 stop:553 length:465 start_codon:yes stop_codon:yes gene_type:complete